MTDVNDTDMMLCDASKSSPESCPTAHRFGPVGSGNFEKTELSKPLQCENRLRLVPNADVMTESSRRSVASADGAASQSKPVE